MKPTTTDELVPSDVDSRRGASHGQKIVNWVLALLTIIGAAAVVGFAYLQVLGTAVCGSVPCPNQGPGETVFGLILDAPPVIAAVTIGLSFFTAGRRRGILVPLFAWALLALGFVILIVSFAR